MGLMYQLQERGTVWNTVRITLPHEHTEREAVMVSWAVEEKKPRLINLSLCHLETSKELGL